MDFDTRVGAYAVIVSDQHVLLNHLTPIDGIEAGWTLPGGGLEFGEDPLTAAVREAREETGLEIEIARFLGTNSVYFRAAERDEGRPRRPLHSLQIIYQARIVGGELTAEVNGSTDGVRWFELAEVGTIQRVELVNAAIDLL